jgi:hypothetical protein
VSATSTTAADDGIFDRCVVCDEQLCCEGEWELKSTVHGLAAVCVPPIN